MKIDWRDIFRVSKGERKGMLVVLFVTVVAAVAVWLYPDDTFVLKDGRADKDVFLQFLATVKRTDSVRFSNNSRWKKPVLPVPVLVPFDPNTADSAALVQLGLKPWVVRNILKYRERGGVFRKSDDLARIYGMDTAQFRKLLPYIQIGEAFRPVVLHHTRPDSLPDTLAMPRIQKFPRGVVVDLNQADTTVLKRVPGIGSRLAWLIVDYRKRLGGYCRVEQVAELKQVPDSLLGWFKVGTPSLRQLDLNRCSIERLKAHPYLNFYQAKVIVEHRKRIGRLKSLDQLALYEEFTPADLSRLAPYVRFE